MASLVDTLGGTLGFGENFVARTDDNFVAGVDLRTVFGAQGLNFFGTSYNYASVNNNGNVTLSNSAFDGLWTYTPFGLANGGYPIIAPFFADVDTTLFGGTAAANQVTPTVGGASRGSDLVWYDLDPTGFGTLTVTWDDVGYYDAQTDKLNAFQLQLVGTGGGNFDIIFRYEALNWTTGDASDGVGGLGGTVARAGYSTGDGASWYELPQSGSQDGMLDLENTAGNTGAAGYYRFAVRSGTAASDTITGSNADDLLAGAGGNDVLNGMQGADMLIGNAGADTMSGGAGDDTFVFDGLDTMLEAVNAGIDTVMSSVTCTLQANFENLFLTGELFINGTGNSLNNVLRGNAGDNVLNGGLGLDTVDYSLATFDITVNLASALAQFINGQGFDTLVAIENVIGSNFDDTLYGTAGANVLQGGLGSDWMEGGAGNDTYHVDVLTDTVVDTAGTDTVHSSITYILDGSIENLRLLGSASINGTGNALNNVIYAGAGNNVINGGAGADEVSYADAASGVTVSLAIATAQATGGSGSDTLTGIEHLSGSRFADRLTGNAATNWLQGGGGNDTMDGGAGIDRVSYATATSAVNVNLAVTSAQATGGGGINTLVNIEDLWGTNYADMLTGNATANTLVGFNGHDVISGGAGNDSLYGDGGNDLLLGGVGSDKFIFRTGLNAVNNHDTIVDFEVAGGDRIVLDDAIFNKLGVAGMAVNSAYLRVGAAAADANDYLVYDASSGGLYYDADGSGAGAQVLFATLDAGLNLVAGHFALI
jgi:Ca2+-binding RTX toxin-like protein